MSIPRFRGAIEWPLVIALGLGAGVIALAQNQEDEEQADGRVVQIGRADEEQENAQPATEGRGTDGVPSGIGGQQQEKYWIGLRGLPIDADHPLRAHVDLPQGQGLLVIDVVADSPAAKAGLKRHEILLRANDNELRDITDLVAQVRAEGEKQGQITLEILRRGERETIYLTPEERPAEAAIPEGRLGRGGFGGDLKMPEGFPNELFGELEHGVPFDFRNFGPGVIFDGQGAGVANMPDGVSINVYKQPGQPARITVKRGDETWEVVGDDEESLEQLPEDLRPIVERMLHGGMPLGMDFQIPNLEDLGRPGVGDERLRQRIDEMERRMEELLRRFDSNSNGRSNIEGAEQTK